MAHQCIPIIFHGPCKNPPAPPPTYLMYGLLIKSSEENDFKSQEFDVNLLNLHKKKGFFSMTTEITLKNSKKAYPTR